MTLTDYQDRITRLQKGLGRAFAEEPFILNIPGKSIALKVDPYYYVALEPHFTNSLSEWSAMLKDNVRETLVRTGNVVTSPESLNPLLKIPLEWGGRRYNMSVCFVESTFIDQALKIYGGVKNDIGLSEISIPSSQREKLNLFFGERTPLQSIAFIDQE